MPSYHAREDEDSSDDEYTVTTPNNPYIGQTRHMDPGGHFWEVWEGVTDEACNRYNPDLALIHFILHREN